MTEERSTSFMAKTRKVLSFLFKLVVSIAAVAYVVWKLGTETEGITDAGYNKAGTWFEVFGDQLGWFLLAGALVVVNLGLETQKWRLLVRRFYPEITYQRAYAAVLAGMAFGIFTPNRIGEYAGRALYLEKGKRVEAVVVTFIDRICQMTVTLVVGLVAILGVVLSARFGALSEGLNMSMPVFAALVGGLLVLTGIIVFLVLQPALLIRILSRFKDKHAWIRKTVFALQYLEPSLVRTILLLSLARYTVFSFQYFVLILAFHHLVYDGAAPQYINLLAVIPLIFLLKSIIPSLGLTEIGIREGVAIQVMDVFSMGASVAVYSTAFLYVINVLLPTLIGAGLLFGMRLQNRKEARA